MARYDLTTETDHDYSELMVLNYSYEMLDILESKELRDYIDGVTTVPTDSVYINFNVGQAAMRGASAGVMTRDDQKGDLLFSHPANSNGYVAVYPVPETGLAYGVDYGGSSGTGDQIEFTGYSSSSGGASESSYFGTSFAAGDVNGDGVGDLLVGAPGWSLDSSVHLFYGPFTSLEGEFDLGDAEAYFEGEDAWDLSGLRVQTAGDIDCDGVPDVAVTAPLAAHPSSTVRTGAVYFFFGPDSASRQSAASTLEWLESFDLDQADAVFWGEAAGDQAGYGFAAAGDVDADGCDDVLIGAPLNDDGGTDAGAAYLLLGSSSLSGDLDDTDAAAEHHGSAGNHLGSAVAGLGDLNSDDYAEYAIGSPYGDYASHTDAGIVELVDGQTGCTRAYVGNADDQLLGWSLVGPIDFNGWGVNDLLLGAPGDSSYYTGGGAVFGFASPSPCTTTPPSPTSVTAANGIFVGRFAGGQFGYSMAVAHDDSGDDHLVVGAPYGFEAEDGEAYWIPGQPLGGTVLAPAYGVPFSQSGSAANFGITVSAGDVTGDGYADVLVGAPKWDWDLGSTTMTNNGASFLLDGATISALAPYSGAGLDPESYYQAVFAGEVSNDRSGLGASIVGDLNQDGEQDIFVGATWSAGAGGVMSGSSYIFLSSHIDP